MNCVTQAECQAVELVEIIDFKWLMARDGHHVHVERLQNDPVYAAAVFAHAAGSPIEAVREAASRLTSRLGIPAVKA